MHQRTLKRREQNILANISRNFQLGIQIRGTQTVSQDLANTKYQFLLWYPEFVPHISGGDCPFPVTEKVSVRHWVAVVAAAPPVSKAVMFYLAVFELLKVPLEITDRWYAQLSPQKVN
jgi:hypothetical protein